MKTILFAHIEKNLMDINSSKVGYKRYYEKEAILAFKSWRKNGGYLKDIPIYAICLTKNTISKETQEELKKLNVTYIEDYQSETDNFKNGYWLIPLTGKYIQNKIQSDFYIKIDLDMYLQKPIPKIFFQKNKITISKYDNNSQNNRWNNFNKFPKKYGNVWDTGIIITEKNNFFKDYYDLLISLEKEYLQSKKQFYKKYLIKIPEDFEYGFLEEFAITILNLENKYNFIPYYNYCAGEFYNNEITSDTCFLHYHIPFEVKEFFKMKKILKAGKIK